MPNNCFIPFKTPIPDDWVPEKFPSPFLKKPNALCKAAVDELQAYLKNPADWSYDFGLNQVGRISSAYFYSLNQRTDFSYTLLEVNDTSRAFGTEMGISTTQDGYFDTTASPKLVRAYDSNKFKII